MKPNFYKSFALSAILTCSLASVAEASRNYELRAFYGDKKDDTVVVVDVKRMRLIEKVQLDEGSTPYPVDRAGYLDKVYAITRNAPSMDVIDAETLQKLGKITLSHTPRSGEAFNSRLGLALVAGADQPISSLIDVNNDTAVKVTTADTETELPDPAYNDHGGGNASGHPAWLSKNKFVVIDRPKRLIQLWGIEKIQVPDSLDYDWELTLLDTVNTPVSVHHILKRNTSMLPKHEKRIFYALAEGKKPQDAVIVDGEVITPATEAVPAAILQLRLTASDQLRFEGQVDLPTDPDMGSHHADFHPDGQHIYVGSAEGHLYVINKNTGDIIKTIDTGTGTGHTRFIPSRNLALVTNHNDDFVTVINTTDHSFKKNIKFNFKDGDGDNIEPVAGEILQSHTNYVSPDNKFYYAFASAYGIFFEINLQNLRVMRTLNTGGVPVQGSFINWDEFSYSAGSSSSGM